MSNKKKVALVLSCGGARGYAHVGAIRELERQGFEVSSVAGSSIGALVGGMYAAGKLEEVIEWACSLDRKDVLSLADWSIGMNHIVKGDKVMAALKRIVPDVNIEDLPIPFRAVSADVKSHEEVVFDHGSLYEAIRASISIPMFFKPVTADGRLLVDGGVVSPLPLDKAVRTRGDLLVAVNVSAPRDMDFENLHEQAELRHRHDSGVLQRLLPSAPSVGSNYFSLLANTYQMMIEANTDQAIRLSPPDIIANIPMNRFGAFDYDKAEKICRFGQHKMEEAIAAYLSGQTRNGFFAKLKNMFDSFLEK